MNKIYSLLLLLTTAHFASVAQDLEAYNYPVYRQFIIQDKFNQKIAEPTPAFNFKVGRQSIAYNDNSQQFKIYHGGQTYKPTRMLVQNYAVGDYLVTFEGGDILYVFEEGETKQLSSRSSQYASSDSMVFFRDDINQKLLIYYDHDIDVLEDFLSDAQINNYSLGDNILAYVNFAEQMKVYYLGEVQTLEYNTVRNLTAARDIVVYSDINGNFKAYYKGESYTLDNFDPKKFWVGDRMVAFIASDGTFKLFYDGSIKDLGFFTPDVVGMKDYIFWYSDFNGYFNVFYQGEFTRADTRMPDEIEAKYGSLVFKDRFKNLKFFRQGKIKTVTSMDVKDVRLDYDILFYTLGINTYKVVGEEEYN